jgi:hypothetical protein
MIEEEYDRWTKDKAKATLDELPSWPVVGPIDHPLVSITVFVVRRTHESGKYNTKTFNLRDYEVALVR